MEVMGQPVEKLAKDAACQLWEDLRWYWPAFGNNGIGESNAISALIRVLQDRSGSACTKTNRCQGCSGYFFQAYTEAPSTPLTAGENQREPQSAKNRRLDLVVTWGCREQLEGRLLVEAKRLHNTSTADSLTRDIDRINEFSFIKENNDGAQVLDKLESDVGLIVALTCDYQLAEWWGGKFCSGTTDSPGRVPKGKWARSWQDLGDALSGLADPVGGYEKLPWKELFSEYNESEESEESEENEENEENEEGEYFLYAFFSRSGCSV
ncbi:MULTISPECIES: hypothetical protein [unclassified Thioalkalivibrio]|uniref:hypothetical protein n=1 Tax=unclassified Thioalkalivibrio TaxID=2621013 RepID=UPI0012DCD925|nr:MULTISPECIES: hypothetical protein [unclassified Thioalkalivibrio]